MKFPSEEVSFRYRIFGNPNLDFMIYSAGEYKFLDFVNFIELSQSLPINSITLVIPKNSFSSKFIGCFGLP